ncbi:hypothetical protein WG66_000774 [Moniliophthora roreri]|nr:hypothetical protein WG66_000774 [Moniliophthora roreri]
MLMLSPFCFCRRNRVDVQNISITNIHQQVPLDIKPPSSHALSPATPVSISGTIAETLPLPTPQLWYAQLIPESQLMDGSSGRIMVNQTSSIDEALRG